MSVEMSVEALYGVLDDNKFNFPDLGRIGIVAIPYARS